MITGETSEAVLKRLLKDKHVDVDDNVFAFLSAPRAPVIETPTKPSTPGAGTTAAGATAGATSAGATAAGTTSPAGGGVTGPTAHLAPATAPLGTPAGATGNSGTSPATGQVYAAGGAPNGDFIGKSVKTIKVVFNKNDVAHQHVQKESSLLNEVGLIYPSSNLATLISIFIAHCDPATKGIAISVRDTVSQLFADMNEFLAAFRDARYPTFHDDCKLAYNELKQSPKESAVQLRVVKANLRMVKEFEGGEGKIKGGERMVRAKSRVGKVKSRVVKVKSEVEEGKSRVVKKFEGGEGKIEGGEGKIEGNEGIRG